MQNHFSLLDTDVMPMFMIIALHIVITLRSSINCSAVICSPIVIFSILREASSETYGPGSIFHHISFRSTILVFDYFLCNLLLSIYIIKIPKNIYLIIIISIRSHFANNHEGIDNPFVTWVSSWCLFVQVFGGLLCSLLLDL